MDKALMFHPYRTIQHFRILPRLRSLFLQIGLCVGLVLCWFALQSSIAPVPITDKSASKNIDQRLLKTDTSLFNSPQKALQNSPTDCKTTFQPFDSINSTTELQKISLKSDPRPHKKKWRWDPRIMVWSYIGLVGVLAITLPILIFVKILTLFAVSIAFWLVLSLLIFGIVFYFTFSHRFDESYKFLGQKRFFKKAPVGQSRRTKSFLDEEAKNNKEKPKKPKSAWSKAFFRRQRRHGRTNWARKNRRLTGRKSYRGRRRKRGSKFHRRPRR